MKNPFAALFRARDKPQVSVSAAPTFCFGTGGSGKAVNAQTVIQFSTVYVCPTLPVQKRREIGEIRVQVEKPKINSTCKWRKANK